MQDRSKWLKPTQVADEIQVSVRTIQRMCREGKITAMKVGQQWRIHPDYKEEIPKSTGGSSNV